ncbi:hypothetical protein ScPMuIL_015179 [Solemya velum]
MSDYFIDHYLDRSDHISLELHKHIHVGHSGKGRSKREDPTLSEKMAEFWTLKLDEAPLDSTQPRHMVTPTVLVTQT